MKKIFCDRCGKEIQPRDVWHLSHENSKGETYAFNLRTDQLDFCQDCINQIDRAISSGIFDHDKGLKKRLPISFSTGKEWPEDEEKKSGPEVTPAPTTDQEPEQQCQPAEEEKPKSGRRKAFDIGKAKALQAAGWTLKKIGDEMGCSAQTVLNHLNAGK